MLAQKQNSEKFKEGRIRLSVVSHEQDNLVNELLTSIVRHCDVDTLFVTVTRNTKTQSHYDFDSFPFPIQIIQNSERKGFGANHNQAFQTCQEEFFCVLNPDILFVVDPFPQLVQALKESGVGVVGPTLYDSQGVLQDSARRFPTPNRIVKKALNRKENLFLFEEELDASFPEWIAGMFMLFPARTFKKIGGFDERYFMYYEDADICRRLLCEGYRTKRIEEAPAVHDARRSSHKSLKFMYWHLVSMIRFFLRYPYYSL